MNETIKTTFLVLVYNILTLHVTLFIDRSNIRLTVERIIVSLTQIKVTSKCLQIIEYTVLLIYWSLFLKQYKRFDEYNTLL